MNRTPIAVLVEAAVEERAGLFVAVEEDAGRLVISGVVGSEGDRQAVLDIATEMADGYALDEHLDVSEATPEGSGGAAIGTGDTAGHRIATPGLEEEDVAVPGDFTDRDSPASPDTVVGPSTSTTSLGFDEVEIDDEGDEAWVPPTDPVVDGDEVVGGLQRSSMDSIEVERSSDGSLGDEAIRDAVCRELRENAMTHGLGLQVSIHHGIVRLRGHVADLDDAEAAEEVASRVPGVREVIESLDLDGSDD